MVHVGIEAGLKEPELHHTWPLTSVKNPPRLNGRTGPSTSFVNKDSALHNSHVLVHASAPIRCVHVSVRELKLLPELPFPWEKEING